MHLLSAEEKPMSGDLVRLSLAAMVLPSTGLATSIVAAVRVSDQDQIRAVIESVDPSQS